MITGNLLGLDPGTRALGWSIVTPYDARVLELGAIVQERDAELAVSTDRAARVHVQAVTLRDVIRRHRVTAIAHEAASFQPQRFTMAAGLCMSIGALTGLAAALGIALYELPPKRWQGAILGRAPTDRRKIEYAEVEQALIAFIAAGGSTLATYQLEAIPAGERNHARDATGIAAFIALRPDEATRIGEP